MTHRVLFACLLAMAVVASAAPAYAKDRATVRAAIDASAQTEVPSNERLARYERPSWQEVATQACCEPEPVCDPCCVDYKFPCGNACEWHGVVSLALWVPGIYGDMTVRGRDAELDSTPMDILENLDKIESIFQGRIAVYRGKWGFSLSGMTVRFEDTLQIDEQGQGGTGRVGLDMAEAYVSYCINRCPLRVDCDPRCAGYRALEVYVGARYWYMELGLDANGRAVPSVRQNKDWVDPIVGAKYTWMLGNGWGFDVQGDIGGFGVGSDFTWNVRAGVHYRFSQMVSLELGAKVMEVDYRDGSGTSAFKFDSVLWGPYFALNFFF